MKNHFQNPQTPRRTGVLLVAALILGAALYSLTGLEWSEDITELLPENAPAIQAAKRVLQDFDTQNTMLIVIGAVDTLASCDDEKLLAAADTVAQRLLTSGLFPEVKYRWDITDALEVGDLIGDHLPRLFTTADSSSMAAAVTRAGIEQRLTDWREALTVWPAPFLTERMRRDPLGLKELAEGKLVSLQALGENIIIHRGYLFTRDRQQVLLIASPAIAMTDSQPATELVEYMQQLTTNLAADNPELRLSYLSGHRFAVNNADQIKRDIKLTVTIATLAIALLSILVYSRAVLVLLTLLPALFGLNLALGIWRWLPGELSAIIVGTGAMLLGITVDYAIHYLYHADQSRRLSRERSPYAGLKMLSKPLLLGAGTTAVAFLALLFSPLPGYRQLGGLVILGVIGSAGFTLYVLPWLLPQRPARKPARILLPLTGAMAACYHWTRNHRRSILSMITVITLLLVPGVLRLQVDGDLQRMNAVSDEIQRDLDQVEAAFSDYLGSASVVVFGPDSETALQKNDAVNQCLLSLQQQGIISSFSSVADLLPAPLAQEENLKRWRTAFNTARQQEIEVDFDAACLTAGVRSGFFSTLWGESEYDTTMLSCD
ncbi:MMPL family transporter, partial [bacterium]|nr:MMPL family transporter [bacterium]